MSSALPLCENWDFPDIGNTAVLALKGHQACGPIQGCVGKPADILEVNLLFRNTAKINHREQLYQHTEFIRAKGLWLGVDWV
jgi:hypothetical protein